MKWQRSAVPVIALKMVGLIQSMRIEQQKQPFWRESMQLYFYYSLVFATCGTSDLAEDSTSSNVPRCIQLSQPEAGIFVERCQSGEPIEQSCILSIYPFNF